MPKLCSGRKNVTWPPCGNLRLLFHSALVYIFPQNRSSRPHCSGSGKQRPDSFGGWGVLWNQQSKKVPYNYRTEFYGYLKFMCTELSIYTIIKQLCFMNQLTIMFHVKPWKTISNTLRIHYLQNLFILLFVCSIICTVSISRCGINILISSKFLI